MSKFIGIDPGKKGCLCILGTTESNPIFCDWPKDDNYSLYFRKLARILTATPAKRYDYIEIIVLEKVHAMPKQGVTSMFNFGMNFGMWKGFLSAIELPYQEVSPQQWMKNLVPKSNKMTTKESVKQVVTKLFPNANVYGPKGAYMSGRGDALLMAEYARRLYKNE